MVDQTQPIEITSDAVDDPFRYETIVAENVTWEQFLVRFAEKHAEWYDGKVILVANNAEHNTLLPLLTTLLTLFITLKGLGRVLSAGVPMRLTEQRPHREPDLLVVLNEHLDRIKENYLDGPADLVVEIVSPESDGRDYGDKRAEYEAGGVREYWLFDPLRKDTIVFSLGEDGRYHRLPLDAQGRLYSVVLPGFAIPFDLLWRDPLPAGAELMALVQTMVQA